MSRRKRQLLRPTHPRRKPPLPRPPKHVQSRWAERKLKWGKK